MKEFETAEEFARRTGRDVNRVWADLRAGRIPALKLGRRYYIDLVGLAKLREEALERARAANS